MDAVEIESLDEDKEDENDDEYKRRHVGPDKRRGRNGRKMRFLGPIRYDLAGFYQILKNNPTLAHRRNAFITNERLVHQRRVLMLCAQNTRCCGRGFHFTPLAKLDDGLIDIVVAKKCGLMKPLLFDDLKAPKNGAHVEKDDVLYIQCKSLKIDTGDRKGWSEWTEK